MTKLIVGLGNPGKDYVKTRHNVGFIILDSYVNESEWKKEKNYMIATSVVNGEKIIFMKPLTFMNLSGIAVREVVNFFKIDVKDILVIHDDLDLEPLKIRFKASSSAGGHNGIKSIIEQLSTNTFVQMKVGIGSNKLIPTSDYVLGKLNKDEYNKLSTEYNTVLEDYIIYGLEKCMNKYN